MQNNLFSLKKIILLFVWISSVVFSQNIIEGDQNERKEVILNSNKIKTVLFNYSSICKPNYLVNIADFVWKDLGYLFEFGPVIAAKVVSETGDTVLITDDSFVLPNQGNFSPDGTVKWGWLPRVGFSNPTQSYVATAKNPSSWPASWTAWPGEYGDGIIISEDEAFYCVDDFSNRMANYFPVPSDTSIRGLGLKMAVRVYQFKGHLQDAIIVKYFITNESQKNLTNIFFGFHGDPHIGGASDYADDLVNVIGAYNPANDPRLSKAKNTIYVWDQNGIGMGGKQTGYLGFKLLETPDKKDLTSFHSAPYTNSLPNVPKNSELMWNWFNAGIDTLSFMNIPQDNVINFSTGPFNLMSGETKVVVLGIFCSENYADLVYDAGLMQLVYRWANLGSTVGSQGGDINYAISIVYPNSGTISGSIPVSWNYTGSASTSKMNLDISSDRGKTWQNLIFEKAINEPFTLNSNLFPDGANYLLRIIAFDSLNPYKYYYDIVDNKFSIDNPPNAKPEIELLINLKDSLLTDSVVTIPLLCEDVDNSILNLKVFYSLKKKSEYIEIFNGVVPNSNYEFKFKVKQIPSSDTVYLKFLLSDGIVDSVILTPRFETRYFIKNYITGNIYHPIGRSTAELKIEVVDSALIKPHTYELTFDSNNSKKYFSISDYNTGDILIDNYPVINSLSTPPFHGIKLSVIDPLTQINLNKTHFSNSIFDTTFSFKYPPEIGSVANRRRLDYDWIIVFNNMDTSMTGQFLFPGDTVRTSRNLKMVMPFRIYSLTHGEPSNYITKTDNSVADYGRWNPKFPFILQPQGPASFLVSYQVSLNFSDISLPGFGDTLFIITDKEITANDVFRFANDSISITTKSNLDQAVSDYYLFQNYPNPFNPTTTINWHSPVAGYTSLKIFNILGQEVATLINNEWKEAGKHISKFSISNSQLSILHSQFSSGVYFYRLEVGSFVQTKKMILLR